MLQVADLIGLVRSRGLEPPRLAALTPQASASTNSATTARHSARTSSKLLPREQAAETSQKLSWVAPLRRLRGPAPAGRAAKFGSRPAPRPASPWPGRATPQVRPARGSKYTESLPRGGPSDLPWCVDRGEPARAGSEAAMEIR